MHRWVLVAVALGVVLPAMALRAEECGLADRGIGGTGGAQVLSDRGIGGTGIPASATSVGVEGRITGFGSVCVNGVEIGLAPGAQVSIDGQRADAGALRIGQVAEIEAVLAEGGLRADRLRVWHAVIGPVEAIGGAGTLRVAGQSVQAEHGLADIGSGDWVAVSGLRDEAGVIHASLVARAPAGTVQVVGPARAVAEGLAVGGLLLPGAPGALAGQRIAAQGRYGGDRMLVSNVIALPSPGLVAGGVLLIEAHARASGTMLELAEGLRGRLVDGVAPPADATMPVVVTLSVTRGGDLAVLGIRDSAGGAAEGRDGRAVGNNIGARTTPDAARGSVGPAMGRGSDGAGGRGGGPPGR